MTFWLMLAAVIVGDTFVIGCIWLSIVIASWASNPPNTDDDHY